jgi:hypothetical protein
LRRRLVATPFPGKRLPRNLAQRRVKEILLLAGCVLRRGALTSSFMRTRRSGIRIEGAAHAIRGEHCPGTSRRSPHVRLIHDTIQVMNYHRFTCGGHETRQ